MTRYLVVDGNAYKQSVNSCHQQESHRKGNIENSKNKTFRDFSYIYLSLMLQLLTKTETSVSGYEGNKVFKSSIV